MSWRAGRGGIGGALALMSALAACGPDQTSGSSFTPIGDGTATGSAASGFYELESLTTSCSGTCRLDLGDGFSLEVCDVGARIDATADVVQTDGHLQIDSDDSDYISRLEGRIDADGGFDVSGVRTELGGSVSSHFRATGTLAALDQAAAVLEGSATGRVTGSVDGKAIDCRLEVDISATRTSGGPR